MEWLGVLLLYLISGFMKKRQQNKNRKIIESDPDWDNEDYLEPEEPSNNFEQLLNDLFEQNPKTPDSSSAVKDLLISENENQGEEIPETQLDQPIASEQIEEDDLSLIDDQVEKFEDKIYHSKLAEREELHFGNKWLKEKLIYNVSEVKKLSDGKIPLISFEGGVLVLNKNLDVVDVIDQRDGLLSNTITSIYVDQNDDIYSTSLLSASKIKLSNSVTSFTESNGIKGLVQKIKKIDDKIYFSTTEDIFRVDESKSSLNNNKIVDLQINDIPKDFISFGGNILSVNNLNSLLIRKQNKIVVSNDRLLESPVKSMLDDRLLIMAHPIEGIIFYKRLNDNRIIKIKSGKILNQQGVIGIKEIAKGVLFVETINNEGSFVCSYDRKGNIKSKRVLVPDNQKVFNSENFPQEQKFNSQIDQEEYFVPLELNLINTGSGYFIFDQNLDLYSFNDEFDLSSTGQNLLSIFDKVFLY
mgnify:CR=1 FL=1